MEPAYKRNLRELKQNFMLPQDLFNQLWKDRMNKFVIQSESNLIQKFNLS